MTRDQQIRKALELLTPPPRQRAECQHDIKVVLDRVERGAAAARSFRLASSKKGKAGTQGLLRCPTTVTQCLLCSRSSDQALVQPRRNSIRHREADLHRQ